MWWRDDGVVEKLTFMVHHQFFSLYMYNGLSPLMMMVGWLGPQLYIGGVACGGNRNPYVYILVSKPSYGQCLLNIFLFQEWCTSLLLNSWPLTESLKKPFMTRAMEEGVLSFWVLSTWRRRQSQRARVTYLDCIWQNYPCPWDRPITVVEPRKQRSYSV